MKYKINHIISLFFILIIILSGCSIGNLSDHEDTENEQVVRDLLDREVTIPKEVERVATLYAPSGYVLALIAHGDKIVAAPMGLKRDQLLTSLYPSIKDIAVPKQGRETNVEELASIQPDLIVINKSMFQDHKEKSKFDLLGVPYIVVDFETLEEQQQTMEIIGSIFNEDEKVADYVNYYNTVLADVTKRTERLPKDKRVDIFYSVNEATRTAPENTLTPQWLEIVGVNNVSNQTELRTHEHKIYASMEQLYQWNPDAILISEMGVDEYILTDSKWKNLDAVRNKQVYLLPRGLTRWGHPSSIEVPLAAMWTAKMLYPKEFSHLHMEEETKEFYSRFFSLTLSDEQVENILQGEGVSVTKGEGTK